MQLIDYVVGTDGVADIANAHSAAGAVSRMGDKVRGECRAFSTLVNAKAEQAAIARLQANLALLDLSWAAIEDNAGCAPVLAIRAARNWFSVPRNILRTNSLYALFLGVRTVLGVRIPSAGTRGTRWRSAVSTRRTSRRATPRTPRASSRSPGRLEYAFLANNFSGKFPSTMLDKVP